MFRTTCGNCARFGIPKGLHSESVLIIALNTVVDLFLLSFGAIFQVAVQEIKD